MFSFHRLARNGFTQFAVALIASASWLSGCGDDEEGDGGGDGKGGSGAMSGSAGSTNGGSAGSAGSTTGGSGGNPSGGSAGTPMGGNGGSMGGSGGSMGGSAGSAGTGTAGEGMGGEGMGGEGMGGEAGTSGMGGEGMGGEGGATDAMCTTANLNVMEVSASPMQQHDHLPVGGMARMTLLGMINTGMPLVFTLPEEGSNTHDHTLTFTAAQLTTLRNGGSVAMITSSMGGPMMNMHTHTYSIECAP